MDLDKMLRQSEGVQEEIEINKKIEPAKLEQYLNIFKNISYVILI